MITPSSQLIWRNRKWVPSRIGGRDVPCIRRDWAIPQRYGSTCQAVCTPEDELGLRSILWRVVLPINCQCILTWIYRFGHAIQTLEREFQWTLDTTNLKIPDNWQYGEIEDFRLTVLVNEEDSDDWNNYKHLLNEWVDLMAIPFDHCTSPIYKYHRARFEYQYISWKLSELLSGVWTYGVKISGTHWWRLAGASL